MSRYYASIRGSAKTEATRRGSAGSGIESHTRGWDVGVRVVAHPEPETDPNEIIRFRIYLTGGSNGGKMGSGAGKLVGTVTLGAAGLPAFVPADPSRE